MHRVLVDEVIHTSYGQFDLVWADGLGFDGDFDRFFAGQINGLVGAADSDGVYINLGGTAEVHEFASLYTMPNPRYPRSTSKTSWRSP